MSLVFLFDSNILIYHFNKELNTRAAALLRQGLAEGSGYSVISKIELLGFQQSEAIEEQVKRFLSRLVEVPLTPDIVEQTILLRKSYRIKLPDAIIAASAIVLNATLITRNSQDFRRIEQLTWIDPFLDDFLR